MSKCRACHQAALGYPSGLQYTQQLVKRRRGSNNQMLIHLPNRDVDAVFPAQALHQHLPRLFHATRDAGNRVIEPLEHFRHSFRKFGDQTIYAYALEWIIFRVIRYTNDPQIGSTVNIPDRDNLFQQIMQEIDTANWNGDHQHIRTLLQYSVQLFEAVGHILSADQGYNYSLQLGTELCDTARNFLPWFMTCEPRMAYNTLQAIYIASGGDVGPITNICRVLGPLERDLLEEICWTEIKMSNSIPAYAILGAIP